MKTILSYSKDFDFLNNITVSVLYINLYHVYLLTLILWWWRGGGYVK